MCSLNLNNASVERLSVPSRYLTSAAQNVSRRLDGQALLRPGCPWGFDCVFGFGLFENLFMVWLRVSSSLPQPIRVAGMQGTARSSFAAHGHRLVLPGGFCSRGAGYPL